MKVMTYRRVARDDSGQALDRQREAVEAYVREKGWEVVNSYSDTGTE